MDRRDSFVRRFLLDDLDIRGAYGSLGGVWQAMQARRGYPPALRDLVGEMAAATAVIAGNLKQPGRLTFQVRGHGLVRLLVIDCDETLNLRGYGEGDPGEPGLAPGTLFGDGHLMLTLDVAGLEQPYRSFVPLEGQSVADMLGAYLRRSEQQETQLWLAADDHQATCLMLQKLPDADARDPDGWGRISGLAATASREELLGLDHEALLYRLFHEETVRLFKPRPVRHDWPPDREKAADMLRSLGRDEIERIIDEHGEARITDDLSNHEYVFAPDELRALFEPPTLQ